MHMLRVQQQLVAIRQLVLQTRPSRRQKVVLDAGNQFMQLLKNTPLLKRAKSASQPKVLAKCSYSEVFRSSLGKLLRSSSTEGQPPVLKEAQSYSETIRTSFTQSLRGSSERRSSAEQRSSPEERSPLQPTQRPRKSVAGQPTRPLLPRLRAPRVEKPSLQWLAARRLQAAKHKLDQQGPRDGPSQSTSN